MGDVVPSQISPRMAPLPSAASAVGVSAGGDDIDWATSGVGVAYSGPDQWKQPARVATTGALTISTGLAPAATVDGIVLAAGDRVLVKDQAAPAQNGIYVADATPYRAFDMDADAEVVGALVCVVAGTANAGTFWRATNTTPPVIDTDPITFAQWAVAAVSGITVEDEGTPLATLGTTLNFVGDLVTAAGSGATKTITIQSSSLIWRPLMAQDPASGLWYTVVDGLSGSAVMVLG